MSDEKTILNNWIREPKVMGSLHEFYISGEIESPECYVDMFDIVRHARLDDDCKFYLNSVGGDLFTAIQFLRVLGESEANIIVSVEGACMSAATLLLLAADSVEITPHSSIMFHDYSSGMWGKGGDMHRQVQHERKWSEAMFREIYEDFLSDSEITNMLNGTEIWMTSEEVVERLEKRAKLRQELDELEKATRP